MVLCWLFSKTNVFAHVDDVRSFVSVRRLAESLGMAVFDVQKQDIHGGTIRVFIGKEGSHDVLPSVAEFIANEKQGGYHDAAVYEDWNREIDGLIADLVTQITALKKGGAKIAAFAASAKEFIASTADFSSGGGKYIIPIPTFKIIAPDGEN